jgi:signal recognition particle receptor subunit beta
MLSLSTKTDRTLFFDFLPLDLGKIRGMRTKLQLYTVPGQVYYNSTRQLVLKGADGVVFVADSQESAIDANLESIQNLEDNLKRQGTKLRDMPLAIQYNKRDLLNALPVEKLNRELNKINAPYFQSVATTGVGVEETLNGVTQLVLGNLVKKYGLEGTEPLEREVQILNPPGEERPTAETLWDDEDPTLPLGSRQMASIEIPLPDEVMSSLPDVGGVAVAEKGKATDGIVREVTVPLTLTLAELRRSRKLRLKITLDVTID